MVVCFALRAQLPKGTNQKAAPRGAAFSLQYFNLLKRGDRGMLVLQIIGIPISHRRDLVLQGAIGTVARGAPAKALHRDAQILFDG